MAKATIIKVETPAELYRRYQGHASQPCYIEVDLEEGTISATYDPNTGSVPASVWHGYVRRFRIPPLTADVANATMEKIKPLVETMLDNWEEDWDGHNWWARLLPEGIRAQEEISELVEEDPDYWLPEDVVFPLEEIDWFPYVKDEVAAHTTDEQLEELARRTVADLEMGVPSGVLPDDAFDDILERLTDYRDELKEEEAAE